MSKVFLHTFGCKANQYDTELIRTKMESGGAQSVEDPREAELCLVNSCSVTAKADVECRQFVRKLLRENPTARMVVTGCYATHAPEELRKISPRVEVYSNQEKQDLAACLGFEVAPETWGLSRYTGRARAFVKIQDGCRAPCRYCIIPQTRPDYWSKPVAQVLNEVAALAANGHGEIVFTGIRLGLYRGEDGEKKLDLAGLLAQVLALPGTFRVRLSSIEVTEVTPALLDLATRSPRLCPHFHIPMQSADDGVLADMGRWYRFADYKAKVDEIRAARPETAITADVLTAFPTETEAAFENTYVRIEALALAGLHAFPYSPRPGTSSAKLTPHPPAVIRRRTQRLIELSDRLKGSFRDRFRGYTRPVLAEDNGEGWTDNYIRVKLPSDSVPGSLVYLPVI